MRREQVKKAPEDRRGYPSATENALLIVILSLLIFSNFVSMFGGIIGDPSLQDNLDGTTTATWSFQNPANYMALNATISGGEANLSASEYWWNQTTQADFDSGSKENVTTTPDGSVLLSHNHTEMIRNGNLTTSNYWTLTNGSTDNVTVEWSSTDQDLWFHDNVVSNITNQIFDSMDDVVLTGWAEDAKESKNDGDFFQNSAPPIAEGTGNMRIVLTLNTPGKQYGVERNDTGTWNWSTLSAISVKAYTLDDLGETMHLQLAAVSDTVSTFWETSSQPMVSGWNTYTFDVTGFEGSGPAGSNTLAIVDVFRIHFTDAPTANPIELYVDEIVLIGGGPWTQFDEIAYANQTFNKQSYTPDLPGMVNLTFDYTAEEIANISVADIDVYLNNSLMWTKSLVGIEPWTSIVVDISQWSTNPGTYEISFQFHLQVDTFNDVTASLSVDNISIMGAYEYIPLGNLTSLIYDAGSSAVWNSISWGENIPAAATSISLQTRTGHSPTIDGTWSDWSGELTISGGEPIPSPSARYIQYRAYLGTLDTAYTPALFEVDVSFLKYSLSGRVETEDFIPLDVGSWEVFNATMVTPAETMITFWFSIDSGSNWTNLNPEDNLSATPIPQIRFRANLETTNTSVTPTLLEMNLRYVVIGPLHHIHMSLATWIGTTDEWVDLDAIGHDAYHHQTPFVEKWETDDPWGLVNTSGLYYPGMVGVWRVYCNNSDDSVSNYTAVSVTGGSVARIGINPWDPGILTTDDTQLFNSIGYDSKGNSIGQVAANWSVSGGIGAIPIGPSSSALFDPTTPGLGTVSADDGNGHSNTTNIIQVVAGARSRIGIEPWNPGALTTDDNVNFAAYSYDSDGNQIGPAIVSWFVNGGIGTIPVGPSQTSVFDATTVGVGTITIDDGMGLTNTTDLIPVIAGQLATIDLNPASVVLLTEEYQNFTAEGYDSDGNSIPLVNPFWETNAGTIVNSSTNGAMLQAQDTELSNGWIRVTAVFQNNVTSNSTIDVAAVNVKPNIVGTIPSQQRPEDYGSWTIDLSSFASDPQDPLSDLTWFFTENDPSLIIISGDEVTGNHIIMFTTVKDAYGSDEMTIWLRDSDGQVDGQRFWVNITPVNDNPIIHSITPFTVHYDVPYTYYFYDYVEDVETPKEELVLESSQPQYVSFAGLWGTFTYPVEFNGQTVYPEVTVYDGDGGWRTTVLAITVSEDYVPVLVRELPDVFIFEGEVARDYFDLDDYFEDPDGDSLYYSSGNVNTQIIIHENHSVDFIAPDDWSGVEIVSFRAIDPYNARAEDIVLVTVLPVNDAPSISGVPDLAVHYDDPSRPNYNYTFDLEPYIYDEDNPISELSISTDDPTHIFFNSSKNSIMEIHYPESMKGQTVVVRITVSDNSSLAYQDINITILENWPPEVSSPIPDYELHEDIPLSNAFDLDNHFIDPEGDELSYSSISNNVFVEIDETTSVVSFSSAANWSGFESVTFRAMDVHGAVLEQTIRVTVIPVNDAPVVYPPIPDQEIAKGAVLTLDLLNHIFDIDNNFSELDISIVSVHSDATLAIAGSYIIFSFDQEGNYIVQLRVSDGNKTAFASFNVRVVGPPAPTIWDQIHWPWSLLVAFLALVIAVLLARQFLGKIDIDEAFLIHADGMLIAHTTIGRETEIDKDIFSGMLTAIQSFIGDSFREVEDSPVKRIEFGDHKIMIEKGKSVYLAVVYRGHENARNVLPIKNAIKEIEKKYSVESVDESSSEFSGVGEIIEKHLKA